MSQYLTRETKHLEIRGDYYYHEDEPSGETYKLDVGAECNRLLGRAEFIESDPNIQPCDTQIVADIRSLVARVADFEELDKE